MVLDKVREHIETIISRIDDWIAALVTFCLSKPFRKKVAVGDRIGRRVVLLKGDARPASNGDVDDIWIGGSEIADSVDVHDFMGPYHRWQSSVNALMGYPIDYLGQI